MNYFTTYFQQEPVYIAMGHYEPFYESVNLTVDGKVCELTFWDIVNTAAQERFIDKANKLLKEILAKSRLRDYQFADVILVCFSIDR